MSNPKSAAEQQATFDECARHLRGVRVHEWRKRPGGYPVSGPLPRGGAACGFPALRSPVCFASRIMGPILPERLRRWSNHSVAIEQLQSLVQPSPTPPRPAEAHISVQGARDSAELAT